VSVGDIEKLAFETAAFDVVIASGVIEYQKDDREALLEMRRVLTRNGHLILNVRIATRISRSPKTSTSV